MYLAFTWHATIVSSIYFLDYTCDTTSKSCRNFNFRISNKPNNNLTLWPKLIFQICTKLLSACFSSSTSTTVALQQVLSCYLHTPGSHQSSLLNRSESVSQSVREQVSDKGKQRLDSGPIKKRLSPLDKKSILAIRKTERLWTIFSWTWLFLQIHPQQNE